MTFIPFFSFADSEPACMHAVILNAQPAISFMGIVDLPSGFAFLYDWLRRRRQKREEEKEKREKLKRKVKRFSRQRKKEKYSEEEKERVRDRKRFKKQ
jgi:hypothetical protein